MTTSQQDTPVFYITGSGVTDDPQQCNELFPQKLKLYVATIMSGDLAEEFPGALPRDFEIRVICASAPTPEMLAISGVAPQGDQANTIRVEFEVLGVDDSQACRVERAPLEVPEISDDLSNTINFALTMGLESMKNGGEACRAAVLKQGGFSLVVADWWAAT